MRKYKTCQIIILYLWIILLSCVCDFCYAETSLRLVSALGEPIGQLSPRTSKEVNKVGSNLGVNIHIGANVTGADIDYLANTGISWVQIHFVKAGYGYSGNLNWDHIDALVGHLRRNEINIMGHVGGIHQVFDPDRNSNPLATPETFESYTTNLSLIVERYKDDIHVWEIFNEVDNALFWEPEPDPDEYETVFNTSANIIRSIQPDAKLITGSITCYFHATYLEEYLNRGIIAQADYYGIHPFRHLPEFGDAAYPHRQDFEWLKGRLQNANLNIQIWDTEVQALTQSNIGGGPIGHERHARLLLRRFIIEKELGYFCTLWQIFKAWEEEPGLWSAADHPGQLLDAQSQPTEKYFALRNLGAWMDGDIGPAENVSVASQVIEKSVPSDCPWYSLGQSPTGSLTLNGSQFTASSLNNNTSVVDLYYVSDCGALDLPGLCVLNETGSTMPYYYGSNYDLAANIGSWFRTDDENDALYIILAKGQTPAGRTFELENVEIALREGREVELSNTMFRQSSLSEPTDPYELYYLKPIHVSPTGASYSVEVNGETWPIAFEDVGGLSAEHYYPGGSDTLYLMLLDGTAMGSYNVKLLPPEIDPVRAVVMKHSAKEDYYITYWQTSYPCENPSLGSVRLELENIDPGLFVDAVAVDLMSGEVFKCPEPVIEGGKVVFEGLPLVDWPILIRSGFKTRGILNLR